MPLLDFNETFIEIKTGVEAILRDHLKESKEESRELINQYLPKISEDVARYSVKAASGDPDAQKAMEHLLAQSKTLAALLGQKQQNRAAETLTVIAMTTAKILGEVLRKILM